VDDLIEAMLRMMNTGDEVPGPINIGNPGEFSMLDLANKVIELTGSKSKLVRMPLPADDPKQRRPDISMAQKELDGWAPRTQLDEGLKQTIAFFDKILAESTAT
jgi:UDP-glucuronate decarboxylase